MTQIVDYRVGVIVGAKHVVASLAPCPVKRKGTLLSGRADLFVLLEKLKHKLIQN